MKSRLKFSLRSLIMLIVAFCVGVTLFNQWKQSVAFKDLTNRLAATEAELDYHRSIFTVVSGLNPSDEFHNRALQIIGRARLHRNSDGSPDIVPLIKPDNPRRIPLYGSKKSRAVVIFSINARTHTTSVATVAALIENQSLIDFRICESTTRLEWHTTSVEGLGSEGGVNLVFNCRPGALASGTQQTLLSYAIQADGFGELVETIVDPDTE